MKKLKTWLLGQVGAFQLWLKPVQHKFLLVLIAVVMVVTQIIPFLQPQIEARRYDLGNVSHLLPKDSALLGQKLTFDGKNQQYKFNENYVPSTSGQMESGGIKSNGSAKIRATIPVDASQGLVTSDPQNNVDFTLTPKFELMPAKQSANRIYYPLKDGTGWLIYTMQADQVAEDLVLTRAKKDNLQIKYDLNLGDKLAAQLLEDGSVGIYGSSLMSGNVSTGTDKDAKLLAQARKNAVKDKLLFTLPKPVIRQSAAGETSVKAGFILKGSELTLDVNGLKTGNYPLDIDPSVYVQSAQGLMYGNNETNVNFDTTNNLFQKTTVSGANIRDGVTQSSWTSSTALPAGLTNMGTAISGGYIYVVGGNNGNINATSSKVYWAKLNVSTSTAIGSWSTNTAYDLPVAIRSLSLVAYNNSLFAIGGANGSGISSSIYSIRIAASGEPTPTWTNVASLPGGTGLQYSSAVAYENQMYLVGGQSVSGGNAGTASTYTATINPSGTLGSWVATTSLPVALYGMSTAIYNDYLYVVGGVSAGTTQTTVYYAKITSLGVLDAWQTNTIAPLTTGRLTLGGNFMTIWAGYMYLAGGCSAVAGAGNTCTSAPMSDIQVASINSDGSIAPWTTLQSYNTGTSTFSNIQQAKHSYGLVSFGSAFNPAAANAGGTLYAIGGCTNAQDATGNCTATSATSSANISSEGDMGPAQTTTALPAGAGAFAAAVTVFNGYVYNIGGCTNVGCTTTSTAIYYAPLNANGTVGTWTATTTALPAARAAAGAAVLGNVLYVAGGTTGTTASANTYSVVIQTTGNINTAFNTLTTGLNAAALYPYTFALTNPSTPTGGYLYTVGGCTQTSATGVGCDNYVATVRRCTVTTIGTVGLTGCTQTGILQLPKATGIAAGARSGNFVYLSSGANSDTSGTAGSWGGQTNLTYYAKIDNTGTLVLPPNRSGTTWATVTAKLANNGITDGVSNNAPGQRRRAAGYAVNGYLYVLGGHDANSTASGTGSTLQDVEIGKIDPTTGDIASFTDNYYQITPRWDFKGVAANGYLYAIGGCSTGSPPSSCTANDRSVQYMQIYNNYSGAPASFTASTNPAVPSMSGSSAVYNGRMYFAGGSITYEGQGETTVSWANINPDGSLGTWTSTTAGATNEMQTARIYFKLLAYNGYLYAIGGQRNNVSTSNATVEMSLLDPVTGVPGAWSFTSALTAARSGVDAAVYNGYIYAVGGTASNNGQVNTVQYAAINSANGTLGTWTVSANTFTTARFYASAVAYNGTLYVIGGYNNTSFLSDVQYAQINANGTIGTFSATQNLPMPLGQSASFAANGYLYVFSGRSNTTTTGCTSNTYVAAINANSTVANGNVPNGIGNWSQVNVAGVGTARFGAAGTYSEGKIYLMGGGLCGTSAVASLSADKVGYYGTVQAQPQVASYSYAIDAANDVFPSKSLFNGIDNGIGANWVLNYRSAIDGATTWGVNTRYGKTTLGTPQAYVPYNGSGTNTSFARYYWIKLSIDGSQAFGFPEDVSRGPTIANLTLQFTANPSQRLRNGKTFINNVQQPLDAPF